MRGVVTGHLVEIMVARSQKIKMAKFDHKQFQKGQIFKWGKGHVCIGKYIKWILKYYKMLCFLLKFSQNRPKRFFFLQDWRKAKKPNHCISRKNILKRPNGNPG
jgi:hypothetical protein